MGERKKMAKKQKQILLLTALAAVLVFFAIDFNGSTGWERVKSALPASWVTPTRTKATSPATRPPVRYVSDPAGVGAGAPKHGVNSPPLGSVTPREQSALDNLIERKLRQR